MVTGLYSYESYAASKASARQPKSNVGYFSLKDDGDEALVRFDYDSVDELLIAHVHDEPVGEAKHRKILCLRADARDDMDKCPLCARGDKYFNKVFLKLIEYVKDDAGRIVPQARVWERPAWFADTIAQYINDYGGIKDVVFKIKRVGVRGAKDTSYIVNPMPSTKYNEDAGFAKDFHEFDNFKLYPHFFLSKTKEEIEEYIQTGEFPFHKSGEAQTSMPTASAVTNDDNPFGDAKQEEKAYEAPVAPTPSTEASCNPAPTPTPTYNPSPTPVAPTQPKVDATDPLMSRPRRRYDYN